jgi:hypothetical protein
MYDEMDIGGFPIELAFLEDGEEYDLAIGHITGPPPTFIEWKIGPQEGEIEANPIAESSTIVGHANSKYAAAVGAASERQTFGELKLQSFSSRSTVKENDSKHQKFGTSLVLSPMMHL